MYHFAKPTLKGDPAQFDMFEELMDGYEPRDEWELTEHGPSRRRKYGVLGSLAVGSVVLVSQLMNRGEDFRLVSQSEDDHVNKLIMIHDAALEFGVNISIASLTVAAAAIMIAAVGGATSDKVKRVANWTSQGVQNFKERKFYKGRPEYIGQGIYASSVAPAIPLPAENAIVYKQAPPLLAQDSTLPFWNDFIDFPSTERRLTATNA